MHSLSADLASSLGTTPLIVSSTTGSSKSRGGSSEHEYVGRMQFELHRLGINAMTHSARPGWVTDKSIAEGADTARRVGATSVLCMGDEAAVDCGRAVHSWLSPGLPLVLLPAFISSASHADAWVCANREGDMLVLREGATPSVGSCDSYGSYRAVTSVRRRCGTTCST